MAQFKALDMEAWPPEFDFWDPCTGRRKVVLCAPPEHPHRHTHTHY